MTTEKITQSDIADLKVSSLPSRPTAPTAFGGNGYTATQMKEAFDKLPLYLVQKFNSLLDDLTAEGPGSLADSLPTGISESHTLADLFADILSGALASYLTLDGEETLINAIHDIRGNTQIIRDDLFALEHLDVNGGNAEETDDTVCLALDTKEGWAASDRVLEEGEPALVKTAAGGYRLKIGNGSDVCSDLPSLTSDVVTHTEASVTVAPVYASDHRFGTLSSLTLTVPSVFDDDYFAFLSFDSGNTPTSFAYTDRAILFSGDDVASGVFVPQAGKHYTLMLWYDGLMQCVVRGVEAIS